PNGSAVVYTDVVTVNGNNTYTTAMGTNPDGFTLPTTVTVTGPYFWTADYSGDGNNAAASDPGTSAAEQVTVIAATPTVVTTASPTGTIALGTTPPTLTDSVVLSGGFSTIGTITSLLHSPNGSAVVYTDVVTVNGNNTYT